MTAKAASISPTKLQLPPAPSLPAVLLLPARLIRVMLLTGLSGLVFVVLSVFAPGRRPVLVRWYFQTAGGLFVKVGQILAHRFDLLPPAFCDELSRLFDRLPPAPAARIIRIIEGSLARPLASCFRDFDEQPLSCASVAQVHAAKLHSGEAVVVKVLRPGAEARFSIDLTFIKVLCRILNFAGIGARLGLTRLADEIAEATREEFDLSRELRNAQQLRERLAGDPLEHSVPEVFPDLSARAVLTMERVDGVAVLDILGAIEANDSAKLGAWAAEGIERERVAHVLLESMLVQIIGHRVFHADPHAANLIVHPGGGLSYVDFGLIGWLDEHQWAAQWRLREALAARKVHAAYEALVSGFQPATSSDMDGFERSVKATLWDWAAASDNPAASVADKSAGMLLLRVLTAARKYRLRLPPGLVRLYKALIVSDMVILRLHPRLDILAAVREILAKQRSRLIGVLAEDFLLAAPSMFAKVAADAPEAMLKLFERIEAGFAPKERSHPSAGAPGRVFRLLLGHAQILTAVLFVALGVRWVFGPLPWLDRVFLFTGLDLSGHPGAFAAVTLAIFVYLRRLQMRLDQ